MYIGTDPQQTAFPLGAYEQAITQVVGMVMACSLLVVNASHRIILPSCNSRPTDVRGTGAWNWRYKYQVYRFKFL